MMCFSFVICLLFQDDHGLKKKITFLKQVLAVQNEVCLKVGCDLYRHSLVYNVPSVCFSLKIHFMYFSPIIIYCVSYFRMCDMMLCTTINLPPQILYSLLKNSPTFQ